MNGDPVEKLVRIGLSEYEARAYVALLERNPVTSDQLAENSGIPRSLGREIAEQLVERGAAVALHAGGIRRYAPVAAEELLDRLHQEQGELIAAIKEDLRPCTSSFDMHPVWNVEGEANILARATGMIRKAKVRALLAALPATVAALRPELEDAIGREAQVVVYTTSHTSLPGGRVIVTPVPEDELERLNGLGLILIRDGQEALIGEWLSVGCAQAFWTRSPTLVSIAEQHLVRGGRRRFLLPVDGGPREKDEDSGQAPPRMRALAQNRAGQPCADLGRTGAE